MKRPLIRKVNIETERKRVNISFSLNEFNDLITVSEYRGVMPGTMAHSLLVQELRREATTLKKAGYLRGQTNLFEKEKGKTVRK